jgi:hypothetical protein
MKKANQIRDVADRINELAGMISDSAALKNFTAAMSSGPSLYFYRKLLTRRVAAGNVDSFVADPYNLELAYAVLGLWGMDTRRARMKDFASFAAGVTRVREQLKVLEVALTQEKDTEKILPHLSAVYETLDIMRGKNKLIGNAKLLHLLFPDDLMPADGENTLLYLYASKSESNSRYLELTRFLFRLRPEIVRRQIAWDKCKDDGWNSTFPKIIDNTIFFLMTPQVNPVSGPVGAVVTITGVRLLQTTKVTFGRANASFKINSDNQVTVVVPTGAKTGYMAITRSRGFASKAVKFTIVNSQHDAGNYCNSHSRAAV